MAKKKPAAAGSTETASITPEVMHEKARDASSALTIYGENPYELVMPDTMPEADFLAFGVNIGRAMEFAGWRIGDWANFGMQKFGYKDYTKMAGVTGLSEDYLRECSSVSGRVPPALRGVASLERAKLMLRRRNEKETIEHLFKRLAGKTTLQLKQMGKSSSGGSGGGGGGSSSGDVQTAAELYALISKCGAAIHNFPQEKWSLLAGLEYSETNGRQMDACRGELRALCDAIAEVHAEQQRNPPATA